MSKDEMIALLKELEKAEESLEKFEPIDSTVFDGIIRRNKEEGTWD